MMDKLYFLASDKKRDNIGFSTTATSSTIKIKMWKTCELCVN